MFMADSFVTITCKFGRLL